MPTDEAAIERLLSWSGIGQAFIKRIERFEVAARSTAPYRPDAPGQHLVDSIGHELSVEGPALIAHVGTNPSEHKRGYAWMVHQGTKPHRIPKLPKEKTFMRFKIGVHTVIAWRVEHPGTTADPFLTRHIRELV